MNKERNLIVRDIKGKAFSRVEQNLTLFGKKDGVNLTVEYDDENKLLTMILSTAEEIIDENVRLISTIIKQRLSEGY